MKDTIITGAQKRRELLILVFSFIFAFLVNIYAIIRFKHPVSELFSQLHIVLFLTLFFYAILAVLRIIWWLLARIYKRFIKS